LVVVAERTAEKARGLGFVQVAVAERAEDAAIVQAVCMLLDGAQRGGGNG
jgi:uroporphyrinogen-III synthase